MMSFNKTLIHFRAVYVISMIFVLQVASLMAQPVEYSAESYHPELFRIEKPDNKRFDFSGMVRWNQTLYGLADKPWNIWLYELTMQENEYFSVMERIPVIFDGKADFEAIDWLDSCFYVADERASKVVKVVVKKDTVTSAVLELLWDVDVSSWGNAGIEGLAVDKNENMIYIAKERDPARLFRISIKENLVTEFLLEMDISDEDISDMKIQDGFLYLLNRAKYRVLKFSLDTRKHLATFDYSGVLHAQNQKFYQVARYPMAEALLIDDKEIWIGLDNNGRSFNDENSYVRQSGLEGSNPVLIRFKRPEQF